ncbi:MAG TPA: thioredoxin family protein [Blastocatellia bacterium]|nr:thioredoxin family protein [Blastocatellia bacterium]
MSKLRFFAIANILALLATGVIAQEQKARPVPKMTSHDVVSSGQPAAPEGDDVQSRSPVVSPVEAPAAIAWQRDLHSAIELASRDNKAILVDVFTDWCGWCKKMDQTIYTNPKVIALSQEVVFVKLNAEDHGPGEQFARENNVSAFPTTIVLDSKGRRLLSIAGYAKSADEFVAEIIGSSSGASGSGL